MHTEVTKRAPSAWRLMKASVASSAIERVHAGAVGDAKHVELGAVVECRIGLEDKTGR